MPIFTLYVERVQTYSVNVEAKDRAEAEEIAKNHTYPSAEYNDVDNETEDVYLINEE